MLENLRALAQPYGGDALLILSLLALASVGVLLALKRHMAQATMRRMVRVVALVALLGSVLTMQLGSGYYGIALLLLIWGVVSALIFARELRRNRP